jgi:glycosyltransferase involved in cell wall biosynthesis
LPEVGDYAAYLPCALQSCLAQSHKRIEVIVVDDGSTDDTKKVVHSFGDGIIYLFQGHDGVSSARNAGLERAAGDFIAFLDADDYLTEDSVGTRLNAFLEHSEIDFVVTATHSNRMGSDMLSCHTKIGKDVVSDDLSELLLSRRLPFATCSILMRGHIAKRFRFPVHLANGEDIAYFSKVFFRRRGCFLSQPTAVTRSHPDSLRHQIEEIRKQGGALVDTIFDDPYYCGALDHLRKDFTAYRYTEFFRRFYQSGDEKAAGRCLLKAVAARPATIFKIDYWIKLIRLYAKKAALPRQLVSEKRARTAEFVLNGGAGPFVLLLSLVSSLFHDITAKEQMAGFLLLTLALFLQFVLRRDPITSASRPHEEMSTAPPIGHRPYLADRLLECGFCVLSGNPYLLSIYPLLCAWSYWASVRKEALFSSSRGKPRHGDSRRAPRILPNSASRHRWRGLFQGFRCRTVGWKESVRIARFVSLGLVVLLIHTIRSDGLVSVLHDIVHPTLEDCDEFFFALFATLLYAASIGFGRMANLTTHAGVASQSPHPRSYHHAPGPN